MEIYLRNTINGLIPLYPSDFDEKRKLKLGQDYKANITNPRNYEFHKKFFALVNIGHENTSLEMPFNTYRKYIIQKAGYFKTYATHKGVMIEADSISFSSMTQDEFEELYSRVIDVIIKDIGSTTEEIEIQLTEFF
jgi:hypothetical protein